MPSVDLILEPYAEKSYRRNIEKYTSLGVAKDRAEAEAYSDVAREFEQGFGEVLSYENHKKILEYISYKESNVIFRFFKGISIDDTFKYKILCAISMVFKKF